MTIKTYRATSVAEALAQVKKDLGRDAVILHTRTIGVGGWFGLRRRQVTEITATTQSVVGAARARSLPKGPPAPLVPAPPVPAPRTPARAPVAANDASDWVSRAGARSPEARAERQAPRTEHGVAAGAGVGVLDVAGAVGAVSPPLKQVAQMIVAATTRTSVEEELAAIKRMVGQVLRGGSVVRQPSMPGALHDCYLRLLESEVAAEIADEIVGNVRDELDPCELSDPATVRQSVLKRLAAYVPVCPDAGQVSRAPDGRPLTIALVGPTGVGKTTTVAKLAATYKLRHGRRVGLVTCDTYRIAAVDQLRTYATIIGLPLKVAMTPAEMRSACAQLSECEVILIDTVGRSPRDAGRVDELRQLIEAARPHQTHLVLSSTGSEGALAEAAARFSTVGCDRLILTKLDEAVNFGVLINTIRKVNRKLSFVTTGQEVPDHIEVGNADRLARGVLDPMVPA